MANNLGTRLRVLGKAAAGVFSERAQKEAFGMLSGIFPGSVGALPSKNTRQFLEAYSDMPWLRAVAGRIATAVAATEWELYVAKGPRSPKAIRDVRLQRAKGYTRRALIKSGMKDDKLTKIESHVMLDTLHNANSFQTGDAMWKVTQLHLDLAGEAFWIKERDGLGVVVGLWPVPPNWIMATPTPTNMQFRVGFRGWQGYVPDTEIIWMADPDPANPYARGTGTTRALSDELETDEYASKHTKAFFYNGARPDLLVYPKAPERMREVDVSRLEENWNNSNQGFWRAFKPYFLTREVGVEKMEQNFRSLQLVQLREQERNIIMQTFGMPPELLGVLENSNRATINSADYLFSKYVLLPRLEFLRSQMQERLVPEYDERLIVNFVNPVQEDRDQQLQAMQWAPFAASIGEHRFAQGLDPLPDQALNDAHVIQNTTTVVSLKTALEQGEKPPAPPQPPGFPPSNGPGGAPKPPKPKPAADDKKSWQADAMADAAIFRLAGDIDGLDEVVKSMAADPEDMPEASAVAAKMERGLIRSLLDAWRQSADAVDMGLLTLATGAQDDERVYLAMGPTRASHLQTEAVQGRIVDGFMAGAEVGGAALRARGVQVRQLDIALHLTDVNPEAVAWAREHAADLVEASAAAKARIRQLIVRSIATGIAPDDLAKLIRDVIGLTDRQALAVAGFRERLAAQGLDRAVVSTRVARYSEAQRRQRALTIARTELIAAVNGGQQALWRMATHRGVLNAASIKREWIVTDDERLEEHCEALGAQDPVGLNEPFEDGLMYPPAHPRCRCAVGLVQV